MMVPPGRVISTARSISWRCSAVSAAMSSSRFK
jgi:hypothetical protein